jgi:hypothetical protein
MNSSPTAVSHRAASSTQILTTDDPPDDTQKTPNSSLIRDLRLSLERIYPFAQSEVKNEEATRHEEATRQQGSLFFKGE